VGLLSFYVNIQLSQFGIDLSRRHLRDVWVLIVEVFLDIHQGLVLPIDSLQVLTDTAHAVGNSTTGSASEASSSMLSVPLTEASAPLAKVIPLLEASTPLTEPTSVALAEAAPLTEVVPAVRASVPAAEAATILLEATAGERLSRAARIKMPRRSRGRRRGPPIAGEVVLRATWWSGGVGIVASLPGVGVGDATGTTSNLESLAQGHAGGLQSRW